MTTTFFGPENLPKEPWADRVEREAVAKALCASCPVEEECLQVALVQGHKDGIWGGHTERERRELRRELLAEQRRDLG